MRPVQSVNLTALESALLDILAPGGAESTEELAAATALAGERWHLDGTFVAREDGSVFVRATLPPRHFRRVARALTGLRRMGLIEWHDRTRGQYGAGEVTWQARASTTAT